MMGAATVALLATLFVGVLGFLSERRIGGWEFDIRGVPHRVDESAHR
jgi:hypothetical protein